MKIIGFGKRRPGMTPEEFREYYETRHVPLILSLLPPFKTYRRNYVRHDEQHRPEGLADVASGPEYDVITEVENESREAYDKVMAALADPEILRLIQEDEERFSDRSFTHYILVDPEETRF